MAEWYTASWVRAPNLHQCLWICLQIYGSKRPGCIADLYKVSRCYTRGESEDHTSEKACKRDPPWLWNPGQTSPVTKSPKQGYQWPHEKDLCPPNFFFKKKNPHQVKGILCSYKQLNQKPETHPRYRTWCRTKVSSNTCDCLCSLGWNTNKSEIKFIFWGQLPLRKRERHVVFRRVMAYSHCTGTGPEQVQRTGSWFLCLSWTH